MIILDTNVISELMKVQPDPQIGEWIQTIGDAPLTTTSITVMEVEYGLQRLPEGRRKAQLAAKFSSLIGTMVVLPFDDIAALKAGQFRASRHAAGFAPEGSDMMIAGIVASVNALLATRNMRDFEGLSLRVIDPWRAN